MDVLEALFTRRSIRRYTGEPISEEDLRLLLKAGFQPCLLHLSPKNSGIIERRKLWRIGLHPSI
ncbi:MAG: hypothetical protein QM224_02030 [Bacillota bacterium]|nr:hypothetical protein [Bacillota bacterium]